jgi:CRISPR-associated endoribonuclease Cas6
MKFRIHLTPNLEPVPFNYAHRLCGVFHRWLGPNDLHNMLSLYSLGWLTGAKSVNGGLFFEHGSHWDIGIYDNSIAEQLVRGLLLRDFNFFGMQIRKVARLESPGFEEGRHRFLVASPVILRKVEDDYSKTFILFNQPKESTFALKKVLAHKLREAKKEHLIPEVSIRFDQNFRNAKTKLIDIKGIKNKGSVCPIIAEGPAEALEFLWEVGAGELTGVGFGSLNHTAPLDKHGRVVKVERTQKLASITA